VFEKLVTPSPVPASWTTGVAVPKLLPVIVSCAGLTPKLPVTPVIVGPD
jgi:hypothetical protein